jgi:hypothetical protein
MQKQKYECLLFVAGQKQRKNEFEDMENTTSDPSRDNDAPLNKSPAQNKHFKFR